MSCPTCGSPSPQLYPVPDIGPHGRTPDSLIGSEIDHTADCADPLHEEGDES